MKQFHLSAILSISTGVLVCDLDDVFNILNFMTNDDLFTHQLSRAADECKPYLIEQFPFLNELPKFTRENWRRETDNAILAYGEYHSVRPIHPEDHQIISPAAEIVIMNPNMKIITFDLDTGDVETDEDVDPDAKWDEGRL